MSGNITYNVSIPQLPELQKAFSQSSSTVKQAVTKAMNASLNDYQKTAKHLAPVDSGHLMGSIEKQNATWVGNTATGSVGTDKEYAVYQEAGTGVYGPEHRPITPKTKPYLMFKTKSGQWIKTKSVKGVKPTWFMRNTVKQNQPVTENYFQQALEYVTRAIARQA